MRRPGDRPAPDPAGIYRAGFEARSREAARLARRSRWISNARLAVFAAGGLLAWLALGPGLLPAPLPLAAAGLFGALVVYHDRVIRSRGRMERACAFYRRGLDRLEHRFAGTGSSGERYRDPHHLYAEDLDLFGPGSLFERLCEARSRAGEDTLARWLLEPARAEEVRRRQEAVAELRDRVDLREDLAVLGEQVARGIATGPLVAWARAGGTAPGRAVRLFAAGLALFGAGALVLLAVTPAGPLPLLAALTLEALFAARFRRRVRETQAAADAAGRGLAPLAELLDRLAAESFRSERLREIEARLAGSGRDAAAEIRRLRRCLDLADARRNQLFAPVAALLLWGTQLAFAVEAWRARVGPAVPGWMDALGEIEALLSLAAYAFECPEDCFPEVVPGEPRFEAEALGHPLIPEERCVRNDLQLGEAPRFLVVSGSNMSGKSTLLRSAGVATVLALAGAPVRARWLRLSELQVGASIRILDSLAEGASHFYAEILRLRDILRAAEGGRPVLYLLDEILRGTNSHDRRLGAAAVIRALDGRGAIGLVTTHDLALARIADELAPRGANAHFEDRMEGDRIRFDHRLRPGVVRRSNAIALMRAVGLPV